jgi:membrane-bound metal-dependent hydrolase YbcI (DUF457 family)
MELVLSLGYKRGKDLLAVGHLGLGYLLGKGSSKLLGKKVNVPLIFALSVIPDADILISQLIGFDIHRGPMHSIIILTVAFLPAFAIYRRGSLPYFLAVLSHPLIGDFITGGPVRLLWPVSMEPFGIGIDGSSATNIVLESSIFLISIVIMLKSNDMRGLFQPHLSNLLLSIPTFTVLLPAILGIPLAVPPWLEPPHIVYMFLFLAATIITLLRLFKNGFSR